jgi:hypothetical protein
LNAETFPPVLRIQIAYICIYLVFIAVLYAYFTLFCINITSSFLSLQGFVEGFVRFLIFIEHINVSFVAEYFLPFTLIQVTYNTFLVDRIH